MGMVSIGGALSAASGFFGLGARLRADAGQHEPDLTAAEDDAVRPFPGGLAPGEPCFEAVAQALAEAGYLDDPAFDRDGQASWRDASHGSRSGPLRRADRAGLSLG